MSIVLQGSTSGSITLQEPAVAGTTVLDLPATSGTILVSGTQNISRAALPVGSVLQVVSATKTDTSSSSSSTFADVSGLSVSITPTSASSKILVTGFMHLGWDAGTAKVAGRIMRDSTAIAIGDAAGNRTRTTGFVYIGAGGEDLAVIPICVNFLDSPATTSAVTYKWQFNSMDNQGIVYVNRSFGDTDNSTFGRTVSSITVMEIAA